MSRKLAFLDTTVHIDRQKTAARAEILDTLLAGYDWKFGTSISQLELKATLIQECITIHNELVSGRRFTRVRDALLESGHPQAKLRGHIFNNLLQIWASSFQVGEAEDRRLAEDARLNLEIVIPELYDWFVSDAVDGVLRDRVNCTRALEKPFKKRAAFDNSMPLCDRKKGNKHCTVEDAIRDRGPALVAKLEPSLEREAGGAPAERDKQLARSVKLFEDVIAGRQNDLNHRDCRRCGDCLMALEAQGNATHALSSNAKEWQRLSAATDMKFIHTTFEGERDS